MTYHFVYVFLFFVETETCNAKHRCICSPVGFFSFLPLLLLSPSFLSLSLTFCQVQLYQLLLKCCEDGEDWEGGLKAVREAFQYIPRNLQRPLWSSRVKFLSKLGKNVAEGISKMKESDVSMQARAWLTLASSSTDEQDTCSAYLSSIDITEGTFHQVECLLSFSRYLYRCSYPRTDVLMYVQRALDFLLRIDDIQSRMNGDPGATTGMGGGGEESESLGGASVAGSRLSKGSRAGTFFYFFIFLFGVSTLGM